MGPEDTVAAIATATGESGIAVVRVSGPEAIAIAGKLAGRADGFHRTASHTVHHAWLRDETGRLLDEALVTVLRAPKTYTGEDVVEFGVHGGTVVARRVLRAVLRAGARLADRGEFTRRAFLAGRVDLSRAEAVADLIAAKTDRAADAALSGIAGGLARKTEEIEEHLLDALARVEANIDFVEDAGAAPRGEIEEQLDHATTAIADLIERAPRARRLRDGASVVLVGCANVGKSTLFNALLETDRALVSETPGTTRDFLEAWCDFGGVPTRLIDTAGLREDTGSSIETEGVRRARSLGTEADLRLVLVEAGKVWAAEDERLWQSETASASLLVRTKSDVCSVGSATAHPPRGILVSAQEGQGLGALREAIADRLLEGVGREPEDDIFPGERHEDALRRSLASVTRARETLTRGGAEELIASDLRDAAVAIGEVTGKTVDEEVLNRVFERFCIGK
ncbi:MAG: tRNA uridine-5-carboxymethylaminomethyl(34) synthesis GTPase MnmE [Gemmatimonadota bacterium]|jgi:tRNA modification GTPase|nr:tRNA uridine-5-carboxymethylaminomethyl(34) synthesis GTPase MnmE [Gemmatimonadota bacterium]MDP6460504.1 tRNA uridine-5-carboxymethylaminomethyl(34) synthesis GTPase MnmE [Gemmatimonadota bacterium]MDP6529477.1 tRNA uridine-5-carboxymethylaminomethyl(34) synthesis GTPase MnmE [Gemmatimonadota bacterium]